MLPFLIVASTPNLQLFTLVRKRWDSVHNWALHPESAVERVDERIIRHDVGGASFPGLVLAVMLERSGPGAPGARKGGQAVAQT